MFSSLYEKTRNAQFAKLSSQDIDHFGTLLPETSILTENLTAYNRDWLGVYEGNSALTLKPHNSS